MSKEKDRSSGPDFQRRTFLKGVGLTATATALGSNLAAEQTAKVASSGPSLINGPLVMIWRRVSDLANMKTKVGRGSGWPLVGEDGHSAMYDAGNVLIAYWSQLDLLTRQTPTGAEAQSAKDRQQEQQPVPTNSCTIDTQNVMSTAFNPSNLMTVAVSNPGLATKRLRRFGFGPATEALAAFVDDTGNSTRFLAASELEGIGMIGRSLKTLSDGGLIGNNEAHPLVSYDLRVSSLTASRAFYETVLGLRIDVEAEDEYVFDTGNVALRIRQEDSAGLLDSIRKKLGEDLMVFHSEDIESAVSDLTRAGVVFPNGIEESPHGRLATFHDPDGHSLSIWQAPPQNVQQDIDYLPVLDRLLVNAAAHAA